MNNLKIQKTIGKKRDEFLLGLVGQFQLSDEKKNIFDCYDYVKIVTETTIDDYMNYLN